MFSGKTIQIVYKPTINVSNTTMSFVMTIFLFVAIVNFKLHIISYELTLNGFWLKLISMILKNVNVSQTIVHLQMIHIRSLPNVQFFWCDILFNLTKTNIDKIICSVYYPSIQRNVVCCFQRLNLLPFPIRSLFFVQQPYFDVKN
jgi:hypothetical protein